MVVYFIRFLSYQIHQLSKLTRLDRIYTRVRVEETLVNDSHFPVIVMVLNRRQSSVNSEIPLKLSALCPLPFAHST